MGLGTFRRVAPVLYPLDIPPTTDIAHAHNGFLQAGVDFGIPGLAAYTSIWISAAWLVMSSLRCLKGWVLASRSTTAGSRRSEAKEAGLRAVAIGLGGCVVSSLIYNLTDTVALGAIPSPAWWMMLGLIVSLFRLVRGRDLEENR